MRLLHTADLTLEEFVEAEVPAYTILSHRWISGQEISYEDFTQYRIYDSNGFMKSGWQKITWFASVSRHNYGCEWCWIDTCCIDKKSSAELSEAINSMYKWYQDASICIAYLFDADSEGIDIDLQSCEWFSRGWTLQELLAPEKMDFYDGQFSLIGTKRSLLATVSQITGIPTKQLFRSRWTNCPPSVADIMAWASRRQTSRKEDLAYSLMGLFDVNMPLLYGEGDKAFMRLQHEIIKQSDDESIFAWTSEGYDAECSGNLLAASPRAFSMSRGMDVQHFAPGFRTERPPYTMTNRGLEIDVPQPISKVVCSDWQAELALLDLRCAFDLVVSTNNWPENFPSLPGVEHRPNLRRQGPEVDTIRKGYVSILLVRFQRKEWMRVALPFHILWRQHNREDFRSWPLAEDLTFEKIRIKQQDRSNFSNLLSESFQYDLMNHTSGKFFRTREAGGMVYVELSKSRDIAVEDLAISNIYRRYL